MVYKISFALQLRKGIHLRLYLQNGLNILSDRIDLMLYQYEKIVKSKV